MSGNFISYQIYIPKTDKPDWERGNRHLEAATLEHIEPDSSLAFMHGLDVESEDDDAGLKDARDQVRGDLAELRRQWEGDADRETARYPLGRYETLLTGGTSWGDSPSEMFDVLERIGSVMGLYQALGFNTDYDGMGQPKTKGKIMTGDPERHHEDCDYRVSSAAKQAAEVMNIDLEENSEVFPCTCGGVPEPCEDEAALQRAHEIVGSIIEQDILHGINGADLREARELIGNVLAAREVDCMGDADA